MTFINIEIEIAQQILCNHKYCKTQIAYENCWKIYKDLKDDSIHLLAITTSDVQVNSFCVN